MMRWMHKLMPVLGMLLCLTVIATANAQSRFLRPLDGSDLPFSVSNGSFIQPLTTGPRAQRTVFRANNGFTGAETASESSRGFISLDGEPFAAGTGAAGPRPTGAGRAITHNAPGYAGVPPQSHPWPKLSPFENRFSRHLNENGLWFWENNNGPRRYFAGIEAMLFELADPEQSLFGDVGAANALMTDGLRVGGTRGGDRIFDREFDTEGLRVNWGFWDPDDTGLELVAWWASDVFKRVNLTDGQNVPANNGAGGVVINFPQHFDLVFRQIAANGQFTRMMRPIWRWNDALKLRPTWGGRYTFLGERMSFDGSTTAAFATELDSEVDSHLFGPSAGLHATLGGDALKFTIGSKFILYVNHERQRLSGQNFGDAASITGIRTFSDKDNSTLVSPAFEQTVHAEAPLFQFIPLLNRLKIFRDAKVRGGLTFLWIDEISRPNRSIKFRSLPLEPKLRRERNSYSLFAWDVGVQFQY